MKKIMLQAVAFLGIFFGAAAQPLSYFETTIGTGDAGSANYLSMEHKKVYNLTDARSNKLAIDFALLVSKEYNGHTTAWYNMSGKDSKVPAEVHGTATGINAISFDREQFEKCKTTADLQRMTGHITPASFSHYATVSNKAGEVLYPCFIFQGPDAKRGLIWVDADGENRFIVRVKTMQ